VTRPTLNILLGSGSTMSAGIPSTSEITNHLLKPSDANEHLEIKKLAHCFNCLDHILRTRGQYKEVNFELMLHALEQIEPLLNGSSHRDIGERLGDTRHH
jgi:hypothetical protein